MAFDFGLFGEMLRRKYEIMQQQANADTSRAASAGLTAQSGANLDNVRAGLLPKESAANIAQMQAQTAGQLEQNRYIGPLARSSIGLQGSQAKQNIAQAGYLGTETEGNNILNRIGGSDFMSLLQRIRERQAQLGIGGL